MQFKKIHLETLHSNSKITHNFSKINKRPQWNKRPPWNFCQKVNKRPPSNKSVHPGNLL